MRVRKIPLILFAIASSAFVMLVQMTDLTLEQNEPQELGELVNFAITGGDTTNIPMIAWDFGDGSGLGRYKRSFTASHRFNGTGVYQVFARILGEDLPLTVTQTIYKPVSNPKATRSSTIVIDTTNKFVWVVNPDNNSVSCIDMVTNKLRSEIPSGNHPRTLAIDMNGNAWVANEDDATIAIVSNAGQMLDQIELPYGSRPYGVCFDPQLNYCFVTLQGKGELLKIDAKTTEIVDQVEVGRAPRGIAINSQGTKVYVTQFISPVDNGVVRVIDVASMEVSKEIVLPFDQAIDFEDRGRGCPNFVSSITISPDGTEAWVPSKKDNTARGLFRDGEMLTFDNTVRTIVSRINLETEEEDLDFRVDINDADLACAVEFSPYGNIAIVALQGNNKLTMLDASSNSRLGLLDTDSTALAPQGLAFNAKGTRLYVQNFMSRTITVYNTENIVLSNNFAPVVEAKISTVVAEKMDAEVLLGKQLFYNAEDKRMTSTGYISCATCHLDGGSDERVWDFTERGEGLRNTHSLLGRAGMGMGRVHWTSNFDEIQDFENDIRNGFNGEGFLPDSIFFSGTISDPLGDPKAGLSPELDALAAYVSSLDKVHPSPYRKQDGTLTDDGVAGKAIFTQLECNACHSGTAFTDRAAGGFHNVGTIKASSGQRRNGELTGFGTPTLKGIWETAPYLHDGSAASLRDVLTTRNLNDEHGNISSLSETEIDQLVAYLLQIDETDDETVSSTHSYTKNGLSISLSPNPAKDFVNISVTGNDPKGKVFMYASDGKKLLKSFTVQKTLTQIDVRSFQRGIYIVKYDGNSQQQSVKLILE